MMAVRGVSIRLLFKNVARTNEAFLGQVRRGRLELPLLRVVLNVVENEIKEVFNGASIVMID